MDATSTGKLLRNGARVRTRPGVFARAFSGGGNRILDRVDDGLLTGSIEVDLPDGTRRILGGRKPGFEAVVHLHNWRALVRLATGGSVGWYQAWENGEWSSPDPVPLFALFMANGEALGDVGRARGPWRWAVRAVHWLNRNTRAGAAKNIHAHYDLGNDFYAAWLDPTMSYSSALFEGRDISLEEAQRRKLQRMGERIGVPRRVLDIGCGWGGLSAYLADRGAEVTGISLSAAQLTFAAEHHPKVNFRKLDYRDIAGTFDGIVSVEMVEAVGEEYWPDFMDCIARCLTPGGRAAIQFISIRDSLFDDYAASADFIQTYIFPGGLLIRENAFRQLAQERGLLWIDEQHFGLDYARTLRLWRENFERAVAEHRLPPGFDQRFINLWRFYLIYCEGGFLGRGIEVAQVTIQKPA